jgi:hypothetical protein
VRAPPSVLLTRPAAGAAAWDATRLPATQLPLCLGREKPQSFLFIATPFVFCCTETDEPPVVACRFLNKYMK